MQINWLNQRPRGQERGAGRGGRSIARRARERFHLVMRRRYEWGGHYDKMAEIGEKRSRDVTGLSRPLLQPYWLRARQSASASPSPPRPVGTLCCRRNRDAAVAGVAVVLLAFYRRACKCYLVTDILWLQVMRRGILVGKKWKFLPQRSIR